MATVCELAASFGEAMPTLYTMFSDNIEAATHWGTRWDIVRDETFTREDGATVQQVWGFTSAYARLDGMGGHVSFLMRMTEFERTTEISVTVGSPYEKHSKNSAYYRRNHQVALRMLEFCVAPYDEIHPRVRQLKRLFARERAASAIERRTT
ncbi:MAG: hypothetical protein AAF125_20045 [Chloroflexota bacterium]